MRSEIAVLPAQQPASAFILIFHIETFLAATKHKQSVHRQALQNIRTFLQNESKSFLPNLSRDGPSDFFSLEKKQILKKLVNS